MQATASFRRWFEYERDSHAKVLQSLCAVPPEQRTSEAFQRAVQLMAHLAEARRLWLHRFGIWKQPPADFFPRGLDLEEITRRVQEIQDAWSQYLSELTDAELARVFEYRSLDAGWFRSRVEDILAQLFGHSWYHRGQIALLLRSIGAPPAVTDFVYWTREPIPAPPGAAGSGSPPA